MMRGSTFLALAGLLGLAACAGSDAGSDPVLSAGVTVTWQGQSTTLAFGLTEVESTPFCAIGTNAAGAPERLQAVAAAGALGTNAYQQLESGTGYPPAPAYLRIYAFDTGNGLLPGPNIGDFSFSFYAGTNYFNVYNRGLVTRLTELGADGGWVVGTCVCSNVRVVSVSNTNTGVAAYTSTTNTLTASFRFKRVAGKPAVFYW